MATDIDVRLVEGQRVISDLRSELATASSTLDQVQHVLHDGDRVLQQIDAGLIAAEQVVERGRRVMPKLLVIGGISAAVIVVVVIIRKRQRDRAEPDAPGGNA